jgi:hypothetical protein
VRIAARADRVDAAGVGLVVLFAVLACIVLAPRFGVDSRSDDPLRRWWPGSPR